MLDTNVKKLEFDVNESKFDQLNLNSNLDLNINVKSYSSYRLEIIILPTCENNIDITGTINLNDNASLEVLLIDFSCKNVNVKVNGDLLDYSNAIYQVASVCDNLYSKKVYDIQLNAKGIKTNSLVKMNGVLKDGDLALLGATNIIKGAKKSVARQEGRIINLSKNGKGQVSPMLNIYENDIKASHGAALGQVPIDTLFYLMSRGIDRNKAIKLITIGTLKPFINMLSNKKYVEELTNYIDPSKESE